MTTPQSPTATPPGRVVDPDPGAGSGHTPAEALEALLAGNERFVAGNPRYGHHVNAAAQRSGSQHPYALVLGCIDSRVPLEAVFDQDFGAICVARSGAHVLDQAMIGSVQFAVAELRVPLVMVLGHERCGAVAATVAALRNGRRPAGPLGFIVDQIAPSVAKAGLDSPDVEAMALRHHVAHTVEQIKVLSPLTRPAGGVPAEVVGAIYDLDTGAVRQL